MAKVVWRNEALDDLDRIANYIRHFDGDAADRIVQRQIACGGSLAVFTSRGRPSFAGQREMTNVPPYVLNYAVGDEGVPIMRIRDGAQRSED